MEEVADEGVGLARGSAVTDGDGADFVSADESGEGLGGESGFAGVGVDDVVCEEFAGLVDDGDLAAGAQAGVDAEDGDGASWRAEEKVEEVVAEDLNCVGIGAFLELEAELGLDGGAEQALPAVFDSQEEVRGPVAFCAEDVSAEEGGCTERLQFDEEVEDALAFTAAYGEHAVGGDGFGSLAVVVVHLEFCLLVDGVKRLAADDDALVVHELAGNFAEVSGLADDFGHDVAGSFECILGGEDGFFGIDEGGGEGTEGSSGGLLVPQVEGKRLQALFAGDGGFGAALGPVGQVKVLQLALVEGRFDAELEVVGKLTLFCDGGKYGFTSCGEVAEVGELLLDGADLDLVEVAGCFLTIACDEGDCAAFVQQSDDGNKALQGEVEGGGKVLEDGGGESFCVSHVHSRWYLDLARKSRHGRGYDELSDEVSDAEKFVAVCASVCGGDECGGPICPCQG